TSAGYQDKLAVRATGAAALTLTNPADIAAGATSAVGVVAASAGSLAGNLTLGFTSKALAGTTLADAALAGGSVALTGAAYDYAQPTIASTLSLGNRRVGTSASLLVTNTTRTAAAYQDSLDAVASTTVGTLSLANPANILAGKSGNVTVTAATAGSLAGDVTFALTSNANGVTGLDATTALTGQTVAVTGAAYDLANPSYATTLALGNRRVGPAEVIAIANPARANGAAAYQDSLDFVAASSNAKLTLAGATANVAAGSSADLGVSVNTAGSLAATLSLGLASNANGVSGLTGQSLAAGSITVTGAAYDTARATLAATTLALGDVRPGASLGTALTNTVVTAAAYQDSLDIVASGAPATFTLAAPSKLFAGQSGDVVVTATKAGSLAANISLALTSNANGLTGLANSALAGQTVAVTGAVYDLANPSYAATQALGNLRVGVTARTVDVTNATITSAGYQDKLAVRATGAAALTLTNPADIAAGATS
ncbi:MAG: choice-of-anchor D domain-containing protein, partial [Betaproteobacteria bacterium]|nr:choice-of-anchor D domain-containing protein [Betaproteobacteria bacterium]